MSPDTIKQLHRIEHKLDAILQFLRLGEFFPSSIDSERVCPICESFVKWGVNKEGEVIRQCECNMKSNSLDFNSFTIPKNKGQNENGKDNK